MQAKGRARRRRFGRKGDFVSLLGLHVAARCTVKVMTSQLTVHIQAI